MTQGCSEHSIKVREYFDGRVADYDAFYDPPSRWLRLFNRVFRKAVYLRRDQALLVAQQYGCRTILDVGCGSGQNTVYFARRGIERLVGVDISLEMIGKARALAERAGVADRCEFEHLDFMAMPAGAKFDIVVACGVFDYVEDAPAFLTRMARFADRVLYGSFPGWTLVRSPLRKLRYARRGCPTHFYRRGELIDLFEGVGFGRVEIQPVPSGHLVWSVREPLPEAKPASNLSSPSADSASA